MNAINWKKAAASQHSLSALCRSSLISRQAVRLAPGADLSGKVLSLGRAFDGFFKPASRASPMDFTIGILARCLSGSLSI